MVPPMDARLSPSEELLARTFADWREEFRGILENHRRDIQDRLEKIEREIEKKSDKENVEILVKGIHVELKRHADELSRLHGDVAMKMNTGTMWKIIGLALTIGSGFGGGLGYLIHLILKLKS